MGIQRVLFGMRWPRGDPAASPQEFGRTGIVLATDPVKLLIVHFAEYARTLPDAQVCGRPSTLSNSSRISLVRRTRASHEPPRPPASTPSFAWAAAYPARLARSVA